MATKTPKRVVSSSRPTGFMQVTTENEELRKIQDNVRSAVEGLDKNVILRNKILEDIDLSPDEPDIVQHGLGQRPRGWTIVDRSGPGTVYRVEWNEKTITLSADTEVTVSIMIF